MDKYYVVFLDGLKEIKEFETKKDLLCDINDNLETTCKNGIKFGEYRIFKGKEMKLKIKQIITELSIEENN